MSENDRKEKYRGLDPLPPAFAATSPPIARVREDECIACDRCPPLCFFDAIVMEPRPAHPFGRVAVIIPDNCTGCGLCFEACPVDVIDWAPGPVRDVSRPRKKTTGTTEEEYESF